MDNDFSFEDQYLLSGMRHEWIMNTVPGPRSIGEWLFKADASILKPRLSLKGQCPAFYKLNDPKYLKKSIQVKENDNNHELTVFE